MDENEKNMNDENTSSKNHATVNQTVKSGITFGSALAMVISYTTWHSVEIGRAHV